MQSMPSSDYLSHINLIDCSTSEIRNKWYCMFYKKISWGVFLISEWKYICNHLTNLEYTYWLTVVGASRRQWIVAVIAVLTFGTLKVVKTSHRSKTSNFFTVIIHLTLSELVILTEWKCSQSYWVVDKKASICRVLNFQIASLTSVLIIIFNCQRAENHDIPKSGPF